MKMHLSAASMYASVTFIRTIGRSRNPCVERSCHGIEYTNTRDIEPVLLCSTDDAAATPYLHCSSRFAARMRCLSIWLCSSGALHNHWLLEPITSHDLHLAVSCLARWRLPHVRPAASSFTSVLRLSRLRNAQWQSAELTFAGCFAWPVPRSLDAICKSSFLERSGRGQQTCELVMLS